MSTPTSSAKKKKKKSNFARYSSTPGQSSHAPASFTDDMRDRQARGKDPYRVGSDESEGEEGMTRLGEM